MSIRTLALDDRLYAYLLDVSLREDETLGRLRRLTAKLPEGGMQIAPEQGQFMALLVKLMGARKALEIGTFTGYSALWVALALPPDGRLVACDIDATWTAMARRFWSEAGVADKIDMRLAPALETLDDLIAGGEAGSFDFAFIDAEKTDYDAYFEAALTLLRPGGLIAVDNVFWDGKVADPDARDLVTRRTREFNRKVHGDRRIDLSVVPIGDGLTLARKRP